MFDNGYARASQEYERYLASGGDSFCEPKLVNHCKDEDGSDIREYNCEYCDNKECEYWSEYNG